MVTRFIKSIAYLAILTSTPGCIVVNGESELHGDAIISRDSDVSIEVSGDGLEANDYKVVSPIKHKASNKSLSTNSRNSRHWFRVYRKDLKPINFENLKIKVLVNGELVMNGDSVEISEFGRMSTAQGVNVTGIEVTINN